MTVGKQNSWLFQQNCFYFGGENYFQTSLWKDSEQLLLVCNSNAELLRLVVSTFDSKVASLRMMRKKKLIILKRLQKKVRHFFFFFFCFICLSLLTFELSNINWKCSENYKMLTERTYSSAVFKILLNIITICIFIEQ